MTFFFCFGKNMARDPSHTDTRYFNGGFMWRGRMSRACNIKRLIIKYIKYNNYILLIQG